MDSAAPVVRAYFEALNAEDWERLAGLWADDAELRAVGTRPRRGRDDIMSYFRPLFEPWPHHADQPTRFIESGDTIVVELEFTGVSRTGRRVSFDAVDVFDVRDNAIVRLTTWYDISWVRRQL